MLCGQPTYVQFAVGGSDKNTVFGTKGVSWMPMTLPSGANPTPPFAERAGFRPGDRVQVTCIAPGVIELRSNAMVNR